MSDAADKEVALEQLAKMVQIEIEPTLTADELEEILDRHQRAFYWVTDLDLVYGQYVVPSVRNGHRYFVVKAGTATTEPDWPLTLGDSVGSAPKFEEAGLDYDNVYDVRGAAREAWEVKLAKASELVSNPVSGSENQIFENCQKMAMRFARPLIA